MSTDVDDKSAMVFLLVSLGLGTFSQVESPIPSPPFGNPSGRAANAAIVSQMSQRTGHLVPLVKPLVQPLVSRVKPSTRLKGGNRQHVLATS